MAQQGLPAQLGKMGSWDIVAGAKWLMHRGLNLEAAGRIRKVHVPLGNLRSVPEQPHRDQADAPVRAIHLLTHNRKRSKSHISSEAEGTAGKQ